MKVTRYLTTGLLGIAFALPGMAGAHDRGDRCGNCGTVVNVDRIGHRDSHLGAGTAIGAVAGGLLGHTVGKGDGRTAATVAGAVAGGAVGHAVEKDHRDDQVAWRFAVRMDDGRRINVTQNYNPDIRDGDRVRVRHGHLDRY